MRTRFVLALCALVAVVACTLKPPNGDACQRAGYLLASCGVTLPLLENGECTGGVRLLATCLADHAHTCDELATFMTRIDACANDVDAGDISDTPSIAVLWPYDASARGTGAHQASDVSDASAHDASATRDAGAHDAGANHFPDASDASPGDAGEQHP